jgi:uncharacterized RmlC-like cupin family protein
MSEARASHEWNSLALHRANERFFTRVGEGVELSVVGKNPHTGATALFQRISRSQAELPEAQTHSHPIACQTLVLSGEVAINFGSESQTLKAGDYIRVPADTPHSQTLVSDDAELFVVTEGNPGIDFVVPERWASK